MRYTTSLVTARSRTRRTRVCSARSSRCCCHLSPQDHPQCPQRKARWIRNRHYHQDCFHHHHLTPMRATGISNWATLLAARPRQKVGLSRSRRRNLSMAPCRYTLTQSNALAHYRALLVRLLQNRQRKMRVRVRGVKEKRERTA